MRGLDLLFCTPFGAPLVDTVFRGFPQFDGVAVAREERDRGEGGWLGAKPAPPLHRSLVPSPHDPHHD